ncbi:MAG: APC family permease [Planctomycetota bacterium]|nr:APC family permease [Planctomycetota bacterium]
MNTKFGNLGSFSATVMVVTTVIGAGVFTTTGHFAAELGSSWAVLLTWCVASVIALLSALSTAELGAMMPQSGGDYIYVRRAFGTRAGYVFGVIAGPAAWTVGSAFVAGTLGKHLNNLIPQVPELFASVAAVLILAAIHTKGLRVGVLFNNGATLLKVGLIVGFVTCGLIAIYWGDGSAVDPPITTIQPQPLEGWRWVEKIFFSSILAGFAFAGYNAVVLMAGELKDPGRTIPRALIFGLGGISVLYLLVNLVFVLATDPSQMVDSSGGGISDLGTFTARRLFGDGAATLFDLVFVLILISTLSSCIQVSARISWRMAQDGQMPVGLGKSNSNHAPTNALWLQALLIILSMAFLAKKELLLLNGMCTLIVDFPLALTILRLRRSEPETPRPFKVPLYPWIPLIRILLAFYIGYAFIIEDPWHGPKAVGLIAVVLLLQPILARGRKE